MSRIAILGAGSWGTALSVVFANCRLPHEVTLWSRNADFARRLQLERINESFLPNITLPQVVRVESDLSAALKDAETVICAVPAANARNVFESAKRFLPADCAIVSATKGLEPSSHLRMTEVAQQIFGESVIERWAVLSGPSFASEAARGEPTAVVLASCNESLGKRLRDDLATPSFRLYSNSDVMAVELGGAMKNVVAIAAGVCEGLGFGSNTQAALITRGLAEMTRLSVALGARAETLSGLAGLGDLVLTCTGALSRNRHVGIQLGKGRNLQEILGELKQVAEGVGTAAALIPLAQDAGVELPITEQVYAILYNGKAPREAIRDIMDRPQRVE